MRTGSAHFAKIICGDHEKEYYGTKEEEEQGHLKSVFFNRKKMRTAITTGMGSQLGFAVSNEKSL